MSGRGSSTLYWRRGTASRESEPGDPHREELLVTPFQSDIPTTGEGSPLSDELNARVRSIELSRDEVERYSRHLILPEVTVEGQKRLKAGRVLVIGAGGLGSPLALYLAAVGVGRIGMVDSDLVDYSNLQRQILYSTGDVATPKLESAVRRLKDLNPHVEVVAHETRLTSRNAMEIIGGYDVVADGTDNFPTRYLVNDASVLLKKPNVYGSILRFEGQASVFAPPDGPCYRCLYPEPPPPDLVPSCAEGGVLGILPGLIGLVQATEVVKILTGIGETLTGRLLLYDALHMKFREIKLRRDPHCPVCGESPTIRELIDYDEFCGVPGGREAEETHRAVERSVEEMVAQGPSPPVSAGESPPPVGIIWPRELHHRLDRGDEIVLLDVREPYEVMICRLPDSTLMPLRELPRRFDELDRKKEIVCYCRVGVRSAQAALFLSYQGFRKVSNLEGGIFAWSEDVNSSIPRY